jgi:hypothetical protein
MVQKEAKGLARWWKGLWSRASGAVVDQQEAFVRGKVAGIPVTDEAGNMLVEAGQRIDDQILTQARAAGKIAALASSVLKAQAQDARETVQTHYARTETAREARLLESVEEYREVNRYLGRTLTLDVTDIRGNIVVPSGKTLDREDVDRAREMGLLAALLSVAEQSLPATAPQGGVPLPSPASAPRRAPLLLADPDEEEATQP